MGLRKDRVRTPSADAADPAAPRDSGPPFRETSEHSPLPTLITEGPDHRVRQLNSAFCRFLGIAPAAALGRPLAELIPDWARCLAMVAQVSRTGVADTCAEPERRRPAPAAWSYAVWPVAGGPEASPGVVLQLADTTAAAQFQRDLTAVNQALMRSAVDQHEQVEVLLREVHHRVKNNLQMLADLLYLKAERMASPDAKAAFEDAYTRIFAFARLHEQLYRTMEHGRVHLQSYLEGVVAAVQQLRPDVEIRAHLPDATVWFDLDRAVHLGLLVNELLTNAVTHAVPRGQPGTVTLRLRPLGDHLELRVCDTGPGLPADLDLEQAATLGLRIIHALAQRLNAVVEVANHAGASFTFTIPLAFEAPHEPATT